MYNSNKMHRRHMHIRKILEEEPFPIGRTDPDYDLKAA
jgi:hypothetical protein